MVNKNSLLHENERLDDLQINGLEIIQHPGKFCFGIDAVLLSAFAEVRKKETVIDLCTGTGILPLLLSAKTPAEHIDALELQPESADMAARSIQWNQLEERINIYEGDVCTASSQLGRGKYHVVTVNPPYMNDRHGLTNPDLPLAIARHEIRCSLEDIIRESSRLLRPKGRFYMVHRPFRLADIMVLMRQYRLEPKKLRLVHPFADREPNMILIEGIRDGKPMVKVQPPLIVYDAPGQYTEEVKAMYGLTT